MAAEEVNDCGSNNKDVTVSNFEKENHVGESKYYNDNIEGSILFDTEAQSRIKDNEQPIEQGLKYEPNSSNLEAHQNKSKSHNSQGSQISLNQSNMCPSKYHGGKMSFHLMSGSLKKIGKVKLKNKKKVLVLGKTKIKDDI